MDKADPQGMLAVVAKTPDLWSQAIDVCRVVTLKPIKKIKQIVVCGMGGSAIAGDIVCDLLAATSSVPIIVNRTYQLPASVDSETLVFALSYSGETEETLAAVKSAISRQAIIIGVASGGKLKQLIEENRSPCFVIPAGYQPRAALAFMLVPLLYSLSQLGLSLITDGEVKAAEKLLRQLSLEYSSTQLRSNPARLLASKLLDRIPVVLGTNGITGAAAYRFKCQLNENSKVAALANVFPELNHNELVNLGAVKRGKHGFALVLLRSELESDRMRKRIEITKSLIGAQLGGVNEVQAQGKNHLEQILSLVLLADFTSVYLALARKVDPTEVDVIGRLKKELAR